MQNKKTLTKEQEAKKIKCDILAEKIKTLFMFCADLIKDKELSIDSANFLSKRVERIGSAAVLIEAMGGDYKADEFKAKLQKDRATALYNLINCLESTENKRIEFKKDQANNRKQREVLRNFLT